MKVEMGESVFICFVSVLLAVGVVLAVLFLVGGLSRWAY
jgi:NhaP-type Na+/H+ and K+/H+ antiporter